MYLNFICFKDVYRAPAGPANVIVSYMRTVKIYATDYQLWTSENISFISVY